MIIAADLKDGNPVAYPGYGHDTRTKRTNFIGLIPAPLAGAVKAYSIRLADRRGAIVPIVPGGAFRLLAQMTTCDQAVVRIAELFAIERDIKSAPPDERRRIRQIKAVPKLEALRVWLETQNRSLSSDSNLARACRYPLNRWQPMIRYCDDGRLEISNNLVENALRGVALGRRNWMFVGSMKGGEAAALFYSLAGTCRLNGVEPEA